MAHIFKFPDCTDSERIGGWPDEYAAAISREMRAEGFRAEDIQTVCERVLAYGERYLPVLGLDVDIADLSPEAIRKIEKAGRKLQAQLRQFVNSILVERVETEKRLLALD